MLLEKCLKHSITILEKNYQCRAKIIIREIFTVSQNIHKLEYMLSTVNSIYSIFHIKLIMNILLNICLWKKSMGTLALDLLTRSMVLNWCQFQSQNRTENIFFFSSPWKSILELRIGSFIWYWFDYSTISLKGGFPEFDDLRWSQWSQKLSLSWPI